LNLVTSMFGFEIGHTYQQSPEGRLLPFFLVIPFLVG